MSESDTAASVERFIRSRARVKKRYQRADELAAGVADLASTVTKRVPDLAAEFARRAYLTGGRISDISREISIDVQNHFSDHPFQRDVAGGVLGALAVVAGVSISRRKK